MLNNNKKMGSPLKHISGEPIFVSLKREKTMGWIENEIKSDFISCVKFYLHNGFLETLASETEKELGHLTPEYCVKSMGALSELAVEGGFSRFIGSVSEKMGVSHTEAEQFVRDQEKNWPSLEEYMKGNGYSEIHNVKDLFLSVFMKVASSKIQSWTRETVKRYSIGETPEQRREKNRIKKIEKRKIKKNLKIKKTNRAARH